MNTGAKFSNCRKYRYSLFRIWEKEKPFVMFIGLNPSTADEVKNDPTITRCINFAMMWGYGGVYVGNLFAYRSTNPMELYKVSDPIGPDNDKFLLNESKKAELIIAAWGNHGKIRNRGKEVVYLFNRLFCLGIAKLGHPRHPLYLTKDLKPFILSKDK